MNECNGFLESKLQILQEMNISMGKLSEKPMANIKQTSKKAEAVTQRCQQLVTDLVEARQEEQMLLHELNQLSERREQLYD